MSTWNTEEVTTEILVNGESLDRAPSSQKLSDVVAHYAAQKGLRTVSVFANGALLDPSQGSKTLSEIGATRLEIRTKDQRA